MKRVAFIAVIIIFLMSACKTQQQAVSVNNDDVYSTPSRQKAKSTPPPSNQDLTSALAANPSAVAHDSLKAKAATLDYSDVSYTDRLKKFQHPQSNTSYFGSSSADSSAGCCNSPTVNINLGYGGGYYDGYYDWGSSFSFGFGMGYGWGYPYYWDSPYWWYYYPYPYWGYPYWYHGYYPYYGEGGYYNSYYGPRQSTARNTAYTRDNRGNSAASPASRSQGNVTAAANSRSAIHSAVRSTTQQGISAGSADRITSRRQQPASPERYHFTRPANGRQGTYNRNTSPGNANRESRQQTTPRYTQPNTATVQRQGQVQNYTPGNYRQARSSQEYINPRYQAQNSAGRPATTSGNRGSSTVGQRGNSAGSRTQQYGSPRSFSPSRGYTPSHFAPSGGMRSGGGYSGGGGTRSGGGGGGGGGSRSGGGGGGGGGHSGGGGRR